MTINDLKFMPDFFDRYINQVNRDVDLIQGFIDTKDDYSSVSQLLSEYEDYQYATGKWTPKEVLQHVIDNERIQSYRALAISRKDKSILPGYDEQLYVANANARTLDSLLEEFQIIRESTITLFQSFTDEQMHHEGICFEVRITPLALGFQIIGHGTHHLNTLKEKYFK